MADYVPEREEPMAVMPQQGNILHPKAPVITAFNKKTITIIVIILGVVLFFCLLAIFQSPHKADQTDGQSQAPKKTSGENLIADTVNAIPGSYQGQDFSQKNIPVPVLPVDYQSNAPPKDVNLNNNQLSPEEQAKLKARESPIRFVNAEQLSQNQSQNQKSSNSNPVSTNGYMPATPVMPNLIQDQNGQDEKQAFLNSNTTTTFYTNSMGLRSPLSKFEVKAGSVIPVTLITGINSDLPGYISAQVRQNVYDTATGRFLLIPQGTRVIGIYDSKIAYAQNRLLVSWSRLILPNGKSLALEGMAGADIGGYAGLKDKVNNHWDKIIAGALVTSLFGAGSKMLSASNDDTNTSTSYEQLAASGAASSLAEAGSKVFEKNLNIQPTIEITPGTKFNIFVDRDLILESYQNGR